MIAGIPIDDVVVRPKPVTDAEVSERLAMLQRVAGTLQVSGAVEADSVVDVCIDGKIERVHLKQAKNERLRFLIGAKAGDVTDGVEVLAVMTKPPAPLDELPKAFGADSIESLTESERQSIAEGHRAEAIARTLAALFERVATAKIIVSSNEKIAARSFLCPEKPRGGWRSFNRKHRTAIVETARWMRWEKEAAESLGIEGDNIAERQARIAARLIDQATQKGERP